MYLRCDASNDNVADDAPEEFSNIVKDLCICSQPDQLPLFWDLNSIALNVSNCFLICTPYLGPSPAPFLCLILIK